MNRETAKELLPIIQAYAEGKDVQYYDRSKKKWRYFQYENPAFVDGVKYRIKPEPLECWVAFTDKGTPTITGTSKEYLENIVGTMDGFQIERMVKADED